MDSLGYVRFVLSRDKFRKKLLMFTDKGFVIVFLRYLVPVM